MRPARPLETNKSSAGRIRSLQDESGTVGRIRAPQDKSGPCRMNRGPAGRIRASRDEPGPARRPGIATQKNACESRRQGINGWLSASETCKGRHPTACDANRGSIYCRQACQPAARAELITTDEVWYSGKPGMGFGNIWY